jgi:mono/diheme cytochrome c family protein
MGSPDLGNRLRIVLLAGVLLGTLGCVRGCSSRRPPIHPVPDMDTQPRYDSQSASSFLSDGMTMRAPVEGTIPRTALPVEWWTDDRFQTGKGPDGLPVKTIPIPVDDALRARGEQRFRIYCAPCHDRRGTGRGILFTSGKIPTTSLHIERIVNAPDGELFDIITNGKGLMPSYGYPVDPLDRWAIISYVRKLQDEDEP